MSNYDNVPYDSLPEDRREFIKQFVISTTENVLKMNSDQREAMLKICYQTLEPELHSISIEEFGCESYDEFIYRLALAAAAVDKKFSLGEKRIVKEICSNLGLTDPPNAKEIVKENIENVKQGQSNLLKVSRLLQPTSRGMFLTFTALIFLGDKVASDEEFDLMLKILAP